MPTNAKIPLLGRHTATLTVQGATVDETTGTWTLAGSAVSILGYIDGLNDETSTETERIEGYADTAMNPVPILSGTRVTVTEIMRNASAPSKLKDLYLKSSYNYIQVVETQGDTTTYNLVIEGGSRQRARGKNTYTLSAATTNIGAANPST